MKLSATVKHDRRTTKHYTRSTISGQDDIVHGLEITVPPLRLEIEQEGGSIYLFGYGPDKDCLWDLWFNSEEAVKEYAYNEFGVNPGEWLSGS